MDEASPPRDQHGGRVASRFVNDESKVFFEVVRRQVQSIFHARGVTVLPTEASWSDVEQGARFELAGCAVEIVRDHVLDRVDAVIKARGRTVVSLDQILALNAWKRGTVVGAIVARSPTEAGFQVAVERTLRELEDCLGPLDEVSDLSLKAFHGEYQRFVDEH